MESEVQGCPLSTLYSLTAPNEGNTKSSYMAKCNRVIPVLLALIAGILVFSGCFASRTQQQEQGNLPPGNSTESKTPESDTSKPSEPLLTDFYLFRPGDKTAYYPPEVRVGEAISPTIGIINGEIQPTSYRIEVKTINERIGTLIPNRLMYGQKWEQVINFSMRTRGPEQKVMFYLYKNEDTKPYFEEPLILYVNVR